MTGRDTLPLVVLLALASTPAALRAQQPAARDSAARDSAVWLPAVSITARVAPNAGPAIGSGVPARIETIGGEAIDAWEPRVLIDALAGQAGVALYDDLGSPLKTTLVSRGFTVSPVVGLPQGVSVFLDGVPVNEPDAGQVNFDLLPLEHVREVEFLSGTASLLGPNSLGGAINMITRRGGEEPGRVSGELELSGGSHGAIGGEAVLGGSARDWRWYTGGGHEREDGWRAATATRTSNLFLNVDRTWSRGAIGLQAFGARSYVETAGSLPEPLFRADPDSNFTAGDFEDLEQLHLAAHGSLALGGGQASARLWIRDHGAERFNVNQEDDPDVRSFSDNRTVGLGADWRVATPLAGGTLGVRLGAGGSGNRSRIQLFAERVDPGQTTDVESPIGKVDAYGLADWTLGRLTITGGLRFDRVRVPFRNLIDPTRDTTSTYTRWSPRGGASVRLGRGLTAYLSAGQSFRPPALVELACADPEEPCPLPFALGDDPPLDPVVATTYEAGMQWSAGVAGLLAGVLEASAYRTDVRDDIFLFPYSDDDEPEGSTIDGFFDNIPRTRREGVELAARAAFGRHSLRASWAWTRATFQTGDIELFSIREAGGGENDVEPGDRLPLVPDQTLAAGLSIGLPWGVTVGADGRYVGRRFLRGDEANEEPPLGGYALFDARAAWEFAGWELSGLVYNLFDRRAATYGTFNIDQSTDSIARFLTPAQPRQVRVVLRREI